MSGTVFRARSAARSPWVGRLARLGLAAKGISYALVAVLAIEVALGRGREPADREGGLRRVAADGLGRWLVLALAFGFAAYAVWRLAEALFDRSGEGDDASGVAKRLGALGKACLYAALCAIAVSVLTGSGGGGGGSKEREATGGVLDWPAGRWLVIAVGVAVGGAAAWNAYRALSRKFEEKLGSMDRDVRRGARLVGVAGHLARAVVFGLISWFLIKAAVEHDPDEAVGLDGALARLANETHGKALLGIVAAGLLAYGAYALVEARHRKV